MGNLYGRLRRAAANHDLWLKLRLNHLLRPFLAGRGVIFCLHRVCPERPGVRIPFVKGLEISPALLDRVLVILKERDYDLISLDRALDRLGSPETQRRFAVFTLDDGYEDNLTCALPVFERHGVPFTVFVTNCFPNNSALLWWYLLEDLIQNETRVSGVIEGRMVEWNCGTFEEKCSAYSDLVPYFVFATRPEQERRLKALLGLEETDLTSPARQMALSWKQVRILAEHPLATIGAHTMNHVALARLPLATAYSEMRDSKAQIEAEIAHAVRHFAYPYGGRGAAGQQEFELAKRSGFSSSVTTRSGNIFSNHQKYLHCLPRLGLDENMITGDNPRLLIWLDGLGAFHVNHRKRFVTL
jgi:peptidoglycan/xylan/chitin deacetylase (PgdA/CDA1 family)